MKFINSFICGFFKRFKKSGLYRVELLELIEDWKGRHSLINVTVLNLE